MLYDSGLCDTLGAANLGRCCVEKVVMIGLSRPSVSARRFVKAAGEVDIMESLGVV